jgi:YD repeat-containing protein
VQVDYDFNRNRRQIVDAEDHDGDGVPEATSFAYDGFDRLNVVTDAFGNERRTVYDSASNAVRVQLFGHPPGGPKWLTCVSRRFTTTSTS